MVTADFAVSEMKKAQSFDWASQFTGGADGEMDAVQLKHKGLQGRDRVASGKSQPCLWSLVSLIPFTNIQKQKGLPEREGLSN